jgi:ASC-1-like (ASCH) protein
MAHNQSPPSDLHMVGISCTGAHGSGITIPPLADMIRGVTLVSANFGSDGLPIVYRIEPTHGMTDPKKHIPNVTLVQDDAALNAIVVGLGAFGVVYAVTIETVPFYWIKETREIIEWSEVKKKLRQGLNGDILKYHTNEVLINAYTSRALVTKRELVTERPSDISNVDSNPYLAVVRAIPAFEKIWKFVTQDGLLNDLERDLGNVLASVGKHFPLLVPTV